MLLSQRASQLSLHCRAKNMEVTQEWRLFALLTAEFRLTTVNQSAEYMIVGIPHTSDITRIFILEHILTQKRTVLKICKNINAHEMHIARKFSAVFSQSIVKYHSIVQLCQPPRCIFMHMEYGIPLRSYLKPIETLKNGLTTPHVRKIIHDMGCALQGIHALGYHHRDVRVENFIIVTENGNPMPKLIDLGLSMPRGDNRSAINNQEFVRPPEFVYCSATTAKAQLVYEDQHDIFAFGMTILSMLGISPDHAINYKHEYALKSIYEAEVHQCASRQLSEILNLKPWYQSVRLIFVLGMPPEDHYFYNCAIGKYLKRIYDWNGPTKFRGVDFETELSQEPVLRQFLKQALHWNKSERVQSCKEMFEVHFDLLPIL
jgi:serine/threonine protein kinase